MDALTGRAEAPALLIVYDGDCSFCRAYVRLLRLRQGVGAVELLSARADDPRLTHFIAAGHDLDQGMLVVSGSQVLAGAEALHWLALHAAGDRLADRLHSAMFRYRVLARALYPWLKWGRRLWLALRGKPLIRGQGRRDIG